MSNNLRTALSCLREEFITHLPERMMAMHALLNAIDGGDFDSLEPPHRETHSLTGIAGTHGLMQIHDAARTRENYRITPLAERNQASTGN